MRRAKIFIFALLMIVLCSPFLEAHKKDKSADDQFANLIAAIKPSIVAVGTYYFNDIPKSSYMGTGFVIKGGKRLVTNYHVISPVLGKKKLAYLRIFHKNLPDKGIKAKIIATDEFHDLAILEHAGEALPPLKISDSSNV
ncbi:MAG: trypsin-like peptidase domain-containing protein, partial [Desulfobacteraceae bacterium]|nr:trypsin-like peptidase domain-containing protein [Desulfobacteraceae bacterium]